ncbi:MAG: hypothetical protein AAGF60_01345 [Pseudomonadota bacterium]
MAKGVNIAAILTVLAMAVVIAAIAGELRRPGLTWASGPLWYQALEVHRLTAAAACLALAAVLGPRWVRWAALAVALGVPVVAALVVGASDAPPSAIRTPLLRGLIALHPTVQAVTFYLPLGLMWAAALMATGQGAGAHARLARISLAFIALGTFGFASVGLAASDITLFDTVFILPAQHVPTFAILSCTALWAAQRARPRFAPFWSGLIHLTLGIAALFWGFAVLSLGRVGMPRRYPDYPNAIAGLQGFANDVALAALAITALYALACAAKRKRR